MKSFTLHVECVEDSAQASAYTFQIEGNDATIFTHCADLGMDTAGEYFEVIRCSVEDARKIYASLRRQGLMTLPELQAA